MVNRMRDNLVPYMVYHLRYTINGRIAIYGIPYMVHRLRYNVVPNMVPLFAVYRIW